MDETIVQIAQAKAVKWHNEVNQKYDGLPYEVHLKLADLVGRKYISLIPKEKRAIVRGAIWLHDTLEDCRKTFNDLTSNFCRDVAEIVYAVTNEKGKTRAERANHHYYNGINKTNYVVYVKLCDRMANILYGVMYGGTMLGKYKKEQEHFLNSLDIKGYEVMVADMKVLLEYGIFNFSPTDEVKKQIEL